MLPFLQPVLTRLDSVDHNPSYFFFTDVSLTAFKYVPKNLGKSDFIISKFCDTENRYLFFNLRYLDL